MPLLVINFLNILMKDFTALFTLYMHMYKSVADGGWMDEWVIYLFFSNKPKEIFPVVSSPIHYKVVWSL